MRQVKANRSRLFEQQVELDCAENDVGQQGTDNQQGEAHSKEDAMGKTITHP